MSAKVYDNRRCELGEGPLWHPERGQLFWFDILSRQLMTRDASGTARRWQFDELVSAAGWIDAESLLIASESRLFRFHLPSAREDHVCALEADDQGTRSNDGRADRQGGFWIGTMGKSAEEGRGTIYRWHGGELRRLVEGITIPNAICFAPDGKRAYWGDTRQQRIFRFDLDADGWPTGEAQLFLDLSEEGLNPDGAVVDAEGNLWNAQWGARRVACYSPEGGFLRALDLPAAHTSCPAFGGDDLSTMYVTTALENLDPEEAARSENGMTFTLDPGTRGLPEPKVAL
jgi:sugar lactone lactonase YvrE